MDHLPPGWESPPPSGWAAFLDVPEVELHTELPSTNDRAKELAREGAPRFTAVVAGEQTAGRGREGRKWSSPDGGGLWLSILLPIPSGGPPGVTTLAVGVATARAVEALTPGAGLGLKWPNDLVAGDAETGSGGYPGGKLGGILTELVQGKGGPIVVAGIGVNLRPAEGGSDPSGSPEAERGVAYLRDLLEEKAADPALFPVLARTLVAELRHWADPPPDTLSGELRKEWERRDVLAGKTVVMEGGLRGRALGVALDGTLRLVTPDGHLRSVVGGGIRLMEP